MEMGESVYKRLEDNASRLDLLVQHLHSKAQKLNGRDDDDASSGVDHDEDASESVLRGIRLLEHVTDNNGMGNIELGSERGTGKSNAARARISSGQSRAGKQTATQTRNGKLTSSTNNTGRSPSSGECEDIIAASALCALASPSAGTNARASVHLSGSSFPAENASLSQVSSTGSLALQYQAMVGAAQSGNLQFPVFSNGSSSEVSQSMMPDALPHLPVDRGYSGSGLSSDAPLGQQQQHQNPFGASPNPDLPQYLFDVQTLRLQQEQRRNLLLLQQLQQEEQRLQQSCWQQRERQP
jgi:hypothetical protein